MTGRSEVVFVDTEMTRLFGGGQVFLGRLLPGLVDAGWRVSLVTEGRPLPPLVGQLSEAGVEVAARLWPQPSTVAAGGRRLADWVARRAPKAYVISVSSGIGWAALPDIDTPAVAVAHSDTDTFYRPMAHYREFLTFGVAVSRPIETRLRACLDPRQVAYVPYGVPLPERPPDKPNHGRPALTVAFAGRFSRADKRFHDVVEMAARMAGPDVNFVLLGDGELRAHAEGRLLRPLAEGHVQMPGWLDEASIRHHLASADAIVFASPANEGLPLALLEGMGQGLVPVTTDLPAFTGAFGADPAGIGCAVGDVEAFVAALTALRLDPAERARRQHRAWQQASEFTVEAMVKAYDALLDDAARKPRPRPPSRRVPLLASCRSRYPPPLPQAKALVLRAASRRDAAGKELAPRPSGPSVAHRLLGLLARIPPAWPVLHIPHPVPVDVAEWAERRRVSIDPIAEPAGPLVLGDDPATIVLRGPVTAGRESSTTLSVERAQRFPGLRVARVPHARVAGPVVITDDGYVLRDTIATLSESVIPPGRGPSLDGAFFHLGGPWHQGYCHWLLDILPRLRGWELLGADLPLLLPGDRLFPWQRQSLVAAGAGGADVRFSGAGCAVESLWVASAPGTPGAVDPASVAWWRSKTHPEPAPTPGRHLYVSRAQASKRRLVNEADLAAALVDLGFEFVAAEELTFAEQVAAFAGAAVIAGLHGAGLTNALFAPAGAILVEITVPGYPQATYANLADAVGLRYRSVAAVPDHNPNRGHADVRVDRDTLLDELRALTAP